MVSQPDAGKSSEMRERVKWLLWLGFGILTAFSLWQLETERATVTERVVATTEGPVSLYRGRNGASGPLVVVTHGFAGSRQMMQYISRDLARAGFSVAAFDFYGHGRNPERLSRDVTRIEGTTMQLVAQTNAVMNALKADVEIDGAKALLGHSMATDIIIRAARQEPEVSAIVAISMYSEAITPTFPENLLIISGEWEGRLRDAGKAAIAQVAGVPVEGETAKAGNVTRRAVYTRNTEHVAVLFASATSEETRAWIEATLGAQGGGQTIARGFHIFALLVALVVLTAPVARLLPKTKSDADTVPGRTMALALALPIVPACLAAIFPGGSLFGSAGFGSLFWFFAVWGLVACGVLIRAGYRFRPPDPLGIALLLFWALGVFAVALDRYAAAFLPTGPRFALMLALFFATLPFMLADRVVLHRAPLWLRGLARALPVLALFGCMMLYPQDMGLLFTVLPVMVLFYLVYGTMGHFVARRLGPETAAVALAVILSWSIAASTPLFAG
jgi:dienelactone hydrolase